jgi:hypothetical protein
VLHRFPSGCLGFTSACELREAAAAETKPVGFWAGFKEWMSGPKACSLPAVCIPPGAQLRLTGLPEELPRHLPFRPSEVVVFAELSKRVNTYRDALVLPDGRSILLQKLPEGIRVLVLSLSREHAEEMLCEEMLAKR